LEQFTGRELFEMDTIIPAEAFTIFISSPSGLDTDRSIVMEEIGALSDRQLDPQAPAISVVTWPHDIAAGAGYYGQLVINRQIADYDILVCLVGTRMGTPTPRANSGTEEEFDGAIEAMLSGRSVQVLLFFSNVSVKPQTLDPNQLLLVRAFREKASRLGVLYHTYDNHEAFRHLFRISLREACELLSKNAVPNPYYPKLDGSLSESHSQTFLLGDVFLGTRETGPQRADSHIIPLAEYRRSDVCLTGTFACSSAYFRFGFKYYDSREPLFIVGTVQTVGQNIVVHIGKNADKPTWFVTSHRAGYRIGPNIILERMEEATVTRFALDIRSSGKVTLSLDDKQIYETFFPLDGIPNLAILAWGDEHEYYCEIRDLQLHVCLRPDIQK
jgi:hypothetical protein